MPKAYWIGSHMTVKDADKMQAYAAAAGPAIAAHGGNFLARGGETAVMEGPEQVRVVVTEFPSLQAAKDCYNSDAYQAALEKLAGGVDRSIFIVEGVD